MSKITVDWKCSQIALSSRKFVKITEFVSKGLTNSQEKHLSVLTEK